MGTNSLRYHRKIIRITAEDSPNVQYALAQKARGEEPTGEELVPGVLGWDRYNLHLKTKDRQWQTVALEAQFYQGALNYLFPQDVLQFCKEKARQARGRSRRARSMGVDAAEGGDYTVWTVIDELGVIHQLSIRTQDTSDIPGTTLGLMRQFNLEAENVLFDRGGGGKQHADQLRAKGHDVRTVGFGEAAKDPYKERKRSTIKPPVAERVTQLESGYAFKNRRAEMYGLASILCASGFGIPEEYTELLRQLKAMPKYYDDEGRLFLPPKDSPGSQQDTRKSKETIRSILGRSPDEADSFVLAVYGLLRKPVKIAVGAL